MAFPSTVDTVTVTLGPVLTPAGTPVSGAELRATLPVQVRILSSGFVLPTTAVARTGSDGIATLTLVATDSAGIDVTGWKYTVSAPRWAEAKAVALPAANPTTRVEDLVAVTASDGSTIWTPGALADTTITAVDADAASAFRVQQDARHGAKYAATTIIKPGVAGVVGNAATADDTAAIQALIDATPVGGTLILYPPDNGQDSYRIDGTLTVTTRNLRIVGAGRDVYAANFKKSTGSLPILIVKATGFVAENVGFVGNGALNGVGATANGIEAFGDTNGNLDLDLRGAAFQYLATAVLTHGRNITIDDACQFTSCLRGVQIDGKDATYHTGPDADQNRGHYIGGRYHNIGASAADAAIEVLSTAKLLHAVIAPRLIDSNGLGRHIVLTGTATDPCKGVTIKPAKHTECGADMIVGTYLWNSTIMSQHLAGDATGASGWGSGIVLDNANNVDVLQPTMLQLGKHGIKITASTEVRVQQPRMKALGLDTSTTYDGINIDATSTLIQIHDPVVATATGYGINGSPTGSRLRGGKFTSCALGPINSTTLVNTVADGLNTYAEGKFGRGEDRARKIFDLAAGVATDVATVTGGGNFASFFVRVRYSARVASGDCIIAAERAVRTENGAPVFTTIGADTVAGCTIAFATSSSSAIKITLTSTAASNGTVMVETYGAGASNSTNPRSAQVTML